MTASQLIEHLKAFPPEIQVVVRGYEDGYNDILKLKEVKIKTKADSRWFDGEYEESTDIDAIEAVDLFGNNKNAKDDL